MTISEASTHLTNLNPFDQRVLAAIAGDFTALFDPYGYPSNKAVDRITAQLKKAFSNRGVDDFTLRQDTYYAIKAISIRCRDLIAKEAKRLPTAPQTVLSA
jgi:hypothetical protein